VGDTCLLTYLHSLGYLMFWEGGRERLGFIQHNLMHNFGIILHYIVLSYLGFSV
jgi:hypothetical protein